MKLSILNLILATGLAHSGLINHNKAYSLSHFGSCIVDNEVLVILGETVDHKGKGKNSNKVYSLNVTKEIKIDRMPWISTETEDDIFKLHSLACEKMDKDKDEILCFGGSYDNKNLVPVQGPFISYNHKSGNWTELVSDKLPSSRYAHSTVVMPNDMYLYGGKVFDNTSNYTDNAETELWKLNKNKLWDIVKLNDNNQNPGIRYYSTLTRINSNQFVLLGGKDDKQAYNLEKVYVFDVTSNKWDEKKTTGFPEYGLADHSATFWDNNIIIYGGAEFDTKKIHNEIYKLDVNNWKWTKLTLEEELIARYGHKASMIGDSMLVYFGQTSPPSLNTQLINLKNASILDTFKIQQGNSLEEQNSNQIQIEGRSHTLFTIIVIILVLSLLGYLWYRHSVKDTLDFRPLPTGEENAYDDLEFEEFEPENK